MICLRFDLLISDGFLFASYDRIKQKSRLGLEFIISDYHWKMSFSFLVCDHLWIFRNIYEISKSFPDFPNFLHFFSYFRFKNIYKNVLDFSSTILFAKNIWKNLEKRFIYKEKPQKSLDKSPILQNVQKIFHRFFIIFWPTQISHSFF